MIDLHVHTTASDGLLRPAAVVNLAARAGLRIIAITDHDTVAGLAEARQAAAAHHLRLVDGIEITAVEEGRDVHVLGYFIDPADADLEGFLRVQRASRLDRVRLIADRLRSLGCPVDGDAILARAADGSGQSVGRPQIADALVAAGYAADRRDAFDRLLGAHAPAFVSRCGPPVRDVVAAITAARGVASLAHPRLIGMDEQIPRYAESGLAAIEVRHHKHAPEDEARYRGIAQTLGLAASGGSDFHGDGRSALGSVTIPAADFADLERRRTAPA